MFFLLNKRTDNGVFDDFQKISENFTKLFRRPHERCRTFSENFRKFPKMSEDLWRLPKTFEEDPKIFRWYTNELKCNLWDKLNVSEIIDIFTCEDIISSHVRISYRFYQLITTDFNIIMDDSTRIAQSIILQRLRYCTDKIILILDRNTKNVFFHDQITIEAL